MATVIEKGSCCLLQGYRENPAFNGQCVLVVDYLLYDQIYKVRPASENSPLPSEFCVKASQLKETRSISDMDAGWDGGEVEFDDPFVAAASDFGFGNFESQTNVTPPHKNHSGFDEDFDDEEEEESPFDIIAVRKRAGVQRAGSFSTTCSGVSALTIPTVCESSSSSSSNNGGSPKNVKNFWSATSSPSPAKAHPDSSKRSSKSSSSRPPQAVRKNKSTSRSSCNGVRRSTMDMMPAASPVKNSAPRRISLDMAPQSAHSAETPPQSPSPRKQRRSAPVRQHSAASAPIVLTPSRQISPRGVVRLVPAAQQTSDSSMSEADFADFPSGKNGFESMSVPFLPDASSSSPRLQASSDKRDSGAKPPVPLNSRAVLRDPHPLSGELVILTEYHSETKSYSVRLLGREAKKQARRDSGNGSVAAASVNGDLTNVSVYHLGAAPDSAFWARLTLGGKSRRIPVACKFQRSSDGQATLGCKIHSFPGLDQVVPIAKEVIRDAPADCDWSNPIEVAQAICKSPTRKVSAKVSSDVYQNFQLKDDEVVVDPTFQPALLQSMVEFELLKRTDKNIIVPGEGGELHIYKILFAATPTKRRPKKHSSY